jgi:RsiW-degrading membrane proteinase PrsW (M82 family)
LEPALFLLSIPLAYIPLGLVAIAIWWLDLYEREPLWAVGLTLLWGALGATFIGCAANTLFHGILAEIVGPEYAGSLTAVISAPIVEEAAKGAILLFIMLLPRTIDSITDGIVYASMAAIGFAMTENLLYFVQVLSKEGAAAWTQVVLLRTILSAPMHVLATTCMGVALGWAASRGRRWLGVMPAFTVGYLLAVFIHFAWNFLAVLTEHLRDGTFILLGITMLLGGLVVYALLGLGSIWLDHRLLRRELAEEVAIGVIPVQLRGTICSWLARPRLREQLGPRFASRYLDVAVRLALAKGRYRHRPTARLEAEIQERRRELITLAQSLLQRRQY